MTELQGRAINKIAEAFRIASEFYKHDFIMPTVSFKLKGRRAGYAQFIANKIALNNEMLHANGDAFIDTVPGHEAAHIIARKMYGFGIRPHGTEWKKVMRLIGLEPDRCHEFEIVTNHRYFCKCNDRIFISTRKHNLILQGKNLFYCKMCKHTIRWSKMYDKSIYDIKSDQDNQKTVPSLYR